MDNTSKYGFMAVSHTKQSLKRVQDSLKSGDFAVITGCSQPELAEQLRQAIGLSSDSMSEAHKTLLGMHDLLQKQLLSLRECNVPEVMETMCKQFGFSNAAFNMPPVSGVGTPSTNPQPQPERGGSTPTRGDQPNILSPKSKAYIAGLNMVIRQTSFIPVLTKYMQDITHANERGLQVMGQQMDHHYESIMHHINLMTTSNNGLLMPRLGDEEEDAKRRDKSKAKRAMYVAKRRKLNETESYLLHDEMDAQEELLEGQSGEEGNEEERLVSGEATAEEQGVGESETQLHMMVVVNGCIQHQQVTVPFTVDPSWCIPARKVLRPEMVMQQLDTWPSQLRLGKMKTIEEVLALWDDGANISLKGKEYKLAPLRVLEHPKLRNLWRYSGPGTSMGKPTTLIKNVVFAVHRRVMGFPRKPDDGSHTPMTLHEAIKDLEQVLSSYKSRFNGPHEKCLATASLHKLAEELITGKKEYCLNEYNPRDYEDDVLVGDSSVFTSCSSMWTPSMTRIGGDAATADQFVSTR